MINAWYIFAAENLDRLYSYKDLYVYLRRIVFLYGKSAKLGRDWKDMKQVKHRTEFDLFEGNLQFKPIFRLISLNDDEITRELTVQKSV